MKTLILSLLAVSGFAAAAHAGHAPAHLTVLYKNVPKPGIKPINQSCLISRETSTGEASWYGFELHGQRTADGGHFDMLALTAAHRTFPFGTRVMVKNKRNGKMIVVKITDRGPYAEGRIIDVSKEAARKLSFVANGTAPVEIRRCLSKVAYEKEQRQEMKVKPKAKPKPKKKV